MHFLSVLIHHHESRDEIILGTFSCFFVCFVVNYLGGAASAVLDPWFSLWF